MTTTTSRPASPTQDLWSSILDSVSKSKSIPSKQILILGEPHTGKTTLAASLLQKKLDIDHAKDDFALGFEWADVRDDADEDILARISVYTVQSSNAVHTSLITQVLPPKTALANTLAMIVLDWTKPWTFVDQLELWMKWIENWSKSDASRETEVAREEGKERLQYHFQHYTEPTDEPLPMTTATLASSTLPLPRGTLTSNIAGIPIIVVCAKADLIDDNGDTGAGAGGMGGMVKSKGSEWEERTDGIMQVLRTVCLKYGAALFYSTQVPTTTAVLRQYALNYLFTPSPPQPSMGSTDAPAPVRNIFKFIHPANALDRDRIVIPAGWDSWGKIKILRDDFEPTRWADAWDTDMESFALAPSISGSSPSFLSTTEATLAPPVHQGARTYFALLVGADRGPAPRSLPTIIQPIPEQTFLQQHYETLAKNQGEDPRRVFREAVAPVDGATINSSVGGANGVGVVGPLANITFGLPNVEKALDAMEGGGEMERERPQDRDRDRGHSSRNPPTGPTVIRRDPRTIPPVQTGNAPPGSRPPASPPALGAAGRGGQTQQELLHNFFQSLLTSRTGTGSLANASGPSSSGNASTETQTETQA